MSPEITNMCIITILNHLVIILQGFITERRARVSLGTTLKLGIRLHERISLNPIDKLDQQGWCYEVKHCR
jgi:hypothetical protein